MKWNETNLLIIIYFSLIVIVNRGKKILSVHFSHFLICLRIRDPFILMIMLQKMHLTLRILNLSSVGTDLKMLSTTDFYLPGIVASLAYLLIIN